MSKNIKKILPTLIALCFSSKVLGKELLKNLKPGTMKAICECVINIINKSIKVNDPEKRKINKNHHKTLQKKRKEILL